MNKQKRQLDIYANEAFINIHGHRMRFEQEFNDEIVVQVEVDPDVVVLDLIGRVDIDNLVACMEGITLDELKESIIKRFGLVDPAEIKAREYNFRVKEREAV